MLCCIFPYLFHLVLHIEGIIVNSGSFSLGKGRGLYAGVTKLIFELPCVRRYLIFYSHAKNHKTPNSVPLLVQMGKKRILYKKLFNSSCLNNGAKSSFY